MTALVGRGPLAVGGVTTAGVAALAWLAGLTVPQALAVGLLALPVGIVGTILAGRGRPARPAPAAAPAVSSAGSFDPEEIIHQEANSGRRWRLGDVHFLSAAEKRRLEAERPQVWRAYRARLFRDIPPPPAVPLD